MTFYSFQRTGARPWSETQPQRDQKAAGLLRLVPCTQPRSYFGSGVQRANDLSGEFALRRPIQNAGALSAPALFVTLLLLGMTCLSPQATAASAAPEVKEVEPFVWKVDATNAVTLKGENLSDVRALWTSRHGVIEATQLAGTVEDDGKRLRIEVPVDGLEAPGPFALRIITDAGISAPSVAMLENLPALQPDADGFLTGSGYVSGTVRKEAGERFRIRRQRGHGVNLDVYAGRFGSQLDPVVRLLDGRGRELFYVHDSPAIGVDCRTDLRAPKSGEYVIEIRDAQYGSGTNHRFHLRLGVEPSGWSGPRIVGNGSDLVPAETRDRFQHFLPESRPLAVLCISSVLTGHGFFGHTLWPVANYPVADFPAPLPTLRVETRSHVVPDGASLNAFLTEPNEIQTFTLQINAAGPRRFTAVSRRLGGERDPAFRLKDTAGKTLVTSHWLNQEAVLTFDFKEPGDYQLEVWDSAGQHGEFGGYHVRSERDPAEFELNTETDSLRIPAGGEAELGVTIDRDGYDGRVKFVLAQAPEGVALIDAVAKEKSKEATFKVKLAAGLEPGTTFPVKISGRRGEGDAAPRTPLYTSAYWKKQFSNLHSPMFEFEDTVWVTVLPAKAVEPEK